MEPGVFHFSLGTIWNEELKRFGHGELVSLLAECGFRVERFFPDFDAAPVTEDPDQEDFEGILTDLATAIRP